MTDAPRCPFRSDTSKSGRHSAGSPAVTATAMTKLASNERIADSACPRLLP